MPRYTTKVPKYRHHRGTGQAVVTLSGRDIYLGNYGSPESKAKYNQLVAEWQLNGRRVVPPPRVSDPTVDEVIAPYLEHVRAYYFKDGRPTSSQHEIRSALRPLHAHFGSLAVSDFGPLTLKALRQRMLDEKDWCRTTMNRAVGIIKRMFKWAAENELVSAEIYHRLQTVSGLRKGRTEARESEPVLPAPEEQLRAVLERVSTPVAAMIQLQCYTGMRPDEVVSMRLCDIDRSEKVWVYTPASHKTEHHGRRRQIFIGPNAKRILMPYLRTDPEAHLFTPIAAETERRKAQHAKRRTPLSCGNRPGTNRKRNPKRSPGHRYTVASYRRAITRACEQAFPPPEHLARTQVPGKGKKGRRWETDTEWKERLGEAKWEELKAWRRKYHWSPNQLRHNAATYLRKEFGIEAARVVLGHSSAAVTEVYAEMDFEKARQIMGKVG